MASITPNFISKVYVLDFHVPQCRWRSNYDIEQNDVTLYDLMLWCLLFALIVWIRLVYIHANFQHVTFHDFIDICQQSLISYPSYLCRQTPDKVISLLYSLLSTSDIQSYNKHMNFLYLKVRVLSCLPWSDTLDTLKASRWRCQLGVDFCRGEYFTKGNLTYQEKAT